MSFVGLALVPPLVLQSNLVDYEVSFRHGLVGALYGAVCILGILAAFFPAKCKGVFQKTQNPLHLASGGSLRMTGHHPDCTSFAGNRIRLWGREFCAACSGLLVGAGIALVGCVSQFFVGLNLVGGSVWMLLLGEFGLFLGLVQIKLAGYSKVSANGVFVLGSFITLAEADVLAGSTLVDLFVLGLIVFLLWLRILLSERNNRRICQMCGSCL